MDRKWRLLELYPHFRNVDLFKRFESLHVKQFSVEWDGFVHANINEDEANKLSDMAFVHKSR